MRYFGAIFLLAWLAGWAVGEVLALGFLVTLVMSLIGAPISAATPIWGGDWAADGATGLVVVFLVVWLTLWTAGGQAAITELLRTLAGEDRVSVESLGVELRRRAGPFHRTRTFERSQIRAVRLRPRDHAVVLDTTTGSELITNYGSVDDRRAMADWLRSRLLLNERVSRIDPSAAPPGWTMTVEGGTTRLTQGDPRARIIAGVILWFAALMLAMVAVGADRALGRLIAAAFTMLVAAAAVWVTMTRRAWLVRQGSLSYETRLLAWERTREFKHSRLAIETHNDSDNDVHYRLVVIGSGDRRRIASEIHDDGEIVALGQWLEARTGFPLALPVKMPR